MRLIHADRSINKGWYAGPWNSDLAISIGYANQGVDEPHLHLQIMEIYLVARGTSVIRVEREDITLTAGDLIVIEPGEAHTFLSSSADYLHFVIHVPGLSGEAARQDKIGVSRTRLELPQ
jgi:mannose-6-phosphate isomerase-like protein (cupin superfamily)